VAASAETCADLTGLPIMLRYDVRKRSAGIAYVLWFLFGLLGAHRFYAGRAGTGMATLALTVCALLLHLILVGLVLVPIVWVLIDGAFLIPRMIQDFNGRLAAQLVA
jgi:TM2 domain-containing membrane protein YozV